MKNLFKAFIVLFALVSFVTGATTVRYKVNPKECIACQACIAGCPVKAISLVNKKAYIDPKKCIKCGNCFKVCPVHAISKDSLVSVIDTTFKDTTSASKEITE